LFSHVLTSRKAKQNKMCEKESTQYSHFARFYDLLQSDVNYDEIAGFYSCLIKRYGKTGGTLLDLGCGTGSLSERMCEKGYDVIGVDLSSEMLSVAYNKMCEKELEIQYVCQDMTSLELYGTVDVMVSALDCLNHLDGEKAVKKTFAKAFEYLEQGGLLIFDVNTAYKHKELLGDNVYVFEQEGLFCCWQNFYNEDDDSVDICLDFFEEQEDGSHLRFSEEFTEKAYPLDSISEWLTEAGFELIGMYDGFSDTPADELCERAVFCARKK